MLQSAALPLCSARENSIADMRSLRRWRRVSMVIAMVIIACQRAADKHSRAQQKQQQQHMGQERAVALPSSLCCERCCAVLCCECVWCPNLESMRAAHSRRLATLSAFATSSSRLQTTRLKTLLCRRLSVGEPTLAGRPLSSLARTSLELLFSAALFVTHADLLCRQRIRWACTFGQRQPPPQPIVFHSRYVYSLIGTHAIAASMCLPSLAGCVEPRCEGAVARFGDAGPPSPWATTKSSTLCSSRCSFFCLSQAFA
jgi:hypothetical protein